MLITASNRLSTALRCGAILAGVVLLSAGTALAANGNGNGQGKGNGKEGGGGIEQSSSVAGGSNSAASASQSGGPSTASFGQGPKPQSEKPGKPFQYGVHDCRGGGCKGPLPGTNPPPSPGATALAAKPDEDICGYYEIRGLVLYSRWADASAVPAGLRPVRCR